MEKKKYIKPVLKTITLSIGILLLVTSQEDGTWAGNSDSREADDRFDWGANDDDEETPADRPKTPW